MKVPVHDPDHQLLGLVNTRDPYRATYGRRLELEPPVEPDRVPWSEAVDQMAPLPPRVTLHAERIRFDGGAKESWFWRCDDPPSLYGRLEQSFTEAQLAYLHRVVGRTFGPRMARIIVDKLR